MLKLLSNIINSGVVSNTVSGDGKPDGIARGLEFDAAAFVLGIVVGIIITLSIIGIAKYVKFIIKDNKEIKEKMNSKKSDT